MRDSIHDAMVEMIYRRARKVNLTKIGQLVNRENFILAGGALCSDSPNDYDIFGNGSRFDIEEIEGRCDGTNAEIVSKTINALTVRIDGKIVQICSHWKNSMQNLVKSFDFSHCRAGCLCCFCKCDNAYNPVEAYWEDDFVCAMACGDTKYTGSGEYPINTLVRAGKFYKQGKFASYHSYKISVIQILSDIIKRGLFDADDVQRQLSAISDNIDETDEAQILADILHRDGTPPARSNENAITDDDDGMPF